MQDIVIYILDSAPEAVQSLCTEVCSALSMELDRYKAPLLVLKDGDSPAREAYQLGKWAFLQCCKIVRNAAQWREVVSPLALQVCPADAAPSSRHHPLHTPAVAPVCRVRAPLEAVPAGFPTVAPDQLRRPLLQLKRSLNSKP